MAEEKGHALQYQLVRSVWARYSRRRHSRCFPQPKPAVVPVGAAVVDITPDYPDPDGGLRVAQDRVSRNCQPAEGTALWRSGATTAQKVGPPSWWLSTTVPSGRSSSKRWRRG